MAVQVVTPENFQQLIETGKVDEFKPPEAPKSGEKVEKAAEQSETAKTPERGPDGKFTKSPDGDKTATASESDDDEDEKDLSETVRRKIAKKHKAMKEAEEFGKRSYLERMAAETRAEKLQRELEEERAKSRPATVQKEDKPPKPEDFATVAEYTDALTDYKVEKKFAAEKARQEQARLDAEKTAREEQFAKRLMASKEKYSDFDEVMKTLAGSEMDRVHQDVVEYLQESDFGGDLMYHLAKNQETLDRLRKLSPRRFIAELGKLETKWEKQPESAVRLSEVAANTTVPAVSKAPAPIQPLDGKSATIKKDPKDMNIQELRDHEREEAAKKRARR